MELSHLQRIGLADSQSVPIGPINIPRTARTSLNGSDERYCRISRAVDQLLSDDSLNRDRDLCKIVEAAGDDGVDVAVLLTHETMKKIATRHGSSIDADMLRTHLALNSNVLQVCGQNVRRVIKFVSQNEDERRKQQQEETPVHFPLMTDDEVARISVPAGASASRLREVFSRHGCALVTDVLDPLQCAELERFWQQDLLGTVDAEAPATDLIRDKLGHVQSEGVAAWPSRWKGPLGSKGCASQRSLPHGRFAWAARLHPNVKGVFAKLFDISAEELAVGLDVVFWAASDTTGPVDENKQWLHVDQNFCSGLTHLCAQGVLYVWPSVEANASTTAVWPGSHLGTYNRLVQDAHAVQKGRKTLGSQSVQINKLLSCKEREDLAAQAIAETRRVPCPAGSLLLWDSRTIHQGWAGGPRFAQPICWEPKSRRDENARLRKLYCCAAGVPTSHSSSEGRVHGMARFGRPNISNPTEVKPGMKVTVPYCVKPSQEETWQQLQDTIWADKADPAKNSIRLTAEQGAIVESILRPEVLDAL